MNISISSSFFKIRPANLEDSIKAAYNFLMGYFSMTGVLIIATDTVINIPSVLFLHLITLWKKNKL